MSKFGHRLAVVNGLILLLAVTVGCGGGGDEFFTFDISGGNSLRIEVSHSETNEVSPQCVLVVYNLNKTSGSGPLVGSIQGEVGSNGHVGFAQWTVGIDGSPHQACSNGFEARFTLGGLDYVFEGTVRRKLDPEAHVPTPVGRGTWSRDDGEGGSFVAYDTTIDIG